MSSNGDTSVVLRGVTHGACDFLIKPVRIEELRNVWQHVVRRRRDSVRFLNLLDQWMCPVIHCWACVRHLLDIIQAGREATQSDDEGGRVAGAKRKEHDKVPCEALALPAHQIMLDMAESLKIMYVLS